MNEKDLKQNTPPKLLLRFFRWYCHPELLKHIEGDLMELYGERINESGKWKADLRFIVDVILLFRPGIIRPQKVYKNLNTINMIQNHLKVGWRSIVRKKIYTAINVAGLTLGVTCALLIYCFINYHLSFDNFHSDSDRIYRFVTEQHRDEVSHSSSVPPAFGKNFKEDYTFAEKVARLCTTSGIVSLNKNAESKKFVENAAFAEPEFFDIFNFPLASGSKQIVLKESNTAIVTEKIAKKYFGDESPIGKIIRFENRIDFTITGVLKNITQNTDFDTEIYFSYNTIGQYNSWYAADDAWGGITTDIKTFARLRPNISPPEIEAVLPIYVKKFRAESKNVHHYKLQPLNEVHFDARYDARMDKKIIYVLVAVGFFLIFTACLNFINLATAQTVTRSKEVGVRKTLGGAATQLFTQFTFETGLIVILSAILAVGITSLVLAPINSFFGYHIALPLFSDFKLLLFTIGLIIVVTLLSGTYPGIILSRFKPAQALKGNFSKGSGSFNVRRGLIIIQFTISQILLIGLIVVLSQTKYFKQADMGFNHKAVVMVPVGSNDVKMNTLKDLIAQIPNVENVSLCFASPASNSSWTTTFIYDNRSEMENFGISFRGADENYLSTFDIELLAGRNLLPSDSVKEYLVNETFVKKLGLPSIENILGKSIKVNGKSGPVVGVVNDFHDRSLRSEINPVCITTSSENYHVYAVRINTSDISTTLSLLEKAWVTMYQDQIYSSAFLEDQIASFYKLEEAILKLIQVFSFIALFIGCIGLYGMVSFMAIQRTKEIGIRKVLGGNVVQILWIFGKEFILLVFFAFLIAGPIGWVLMSKWLSLYAYPINLNANIFLFELGVIILIVIMTVGYQSIKAALANPVNSLRTE